MLSILLLQAWRALSTLPLTSKNYLKPGKSLPVDHTIAKNNSKERPLSNNAGKAILESSQPADKSFEFLKCDAQVHTSCGSHASRMESVNITRNYHSEESISATNFGVGGNVWYQSSNRTCDKGTAIEDDEILEVVSSTNFSYYPSPS